MVAILKVPGIGPHLAAILAKQGITTAEQLAATLPATLLDISGVGTHRAKRLLTAANLAFHVDPSQSSKARKVHVPDSMSKAPQAAPAKVNLATVTDEDELATAKKVMAKKVKAKKRAKAKKEIKKGKLKEKAASKKAAKKEAKKKAAKKKSKVTKGKKNGKSKKK